MAAAEDRGRESELFQLDRATCMALLTTQHVGRLVVPDEAPRILPVNYEVHDGSILFRGDHGAHAEGIVDRVVAFEVDMIDDRTRSGWSVIVRGAVTTFAADASGAGIVVDSWAPGPKDRCYVIVIEEVTGRLLRSAVTGGPVDEHGYL